VRKQGFSSIINLFKRPVLIFMVMLCFLPVLNLNPYVYHIVTLALLFASLAVSWGILASAGQISAGHSTFFGLGAYFSYFAMQYYNISFFVAVFLALIVADLAAFSIGYLTFRYGVGGIYFVLCTIAFSAFFSELFITFREFTGGSLGVSLAIVERDSFYYFTFTSKIPYYYAAITLFILCYLTVSGLRVFMKRLSVIRADEDLAYAIGIDVFKYKLLALLLSATFTSLAGSVYLVFIRFIDPEGVFGLWFSVEIMTVALLGGSTPFGQLLSAFILIPIGEVLRAIFSGVSAGLNLLIYGLILALIIAKAPEGLSGLLKRRGS